MQKITVLQSKLTSQSIKNFIIRQGPNLTIEQKQKLTQGLLKKTIFTAPIRKVLFAEGQKCSQGYLIVDGEVTLIKKCSNNEKMYLAQVGCWYVLNLQAKLNKWTVKYTAIVKTSEVKYIKLTQQQLIILFNCQSKIIQSIQTKRDKSFEKKQKKNQIKEQKQRRQSLVNKLSLPQIKTERKSVGSYRQKQKKSTPKTILQKMAENMVYPQKIHQNFSSKQLAKYKQSKSIQTARKTTQDAEAERNDKIFKEQLKDIIKRKLTYERKHLAVLKAFREDNKRQDFNLENKKIGIMNNLEQPNIDDYFAQ